MDLIVKYCKIQGNIYSKVQCTVTECKKVTKCQVAKSLALMEVNIQDKHKDLSFKMV